MSDDFQVRRLHVGDAILLSALLQAQSSEYLRYFTPFQFDEATLTALLNCAKQDIFMGLFWDDRLAGFFMLRGWDAGYAIPSYGVAIGEQFRNWGLGRLTLELSKVICRLHGAPRLMLKVHPDNGPAKHLYETAGFVQTGVDSKNDNLIYHFDFI